MTTLQIDDPYITTVLDTKFHNDKARLIVAIKELFKTDSRIETQEYNLLKAYDSGELSIGQISKFLSISKSEAIELLEKYNIPFIRADKEYLEQEFAAFN
jgi:predicted HTH domain antitoxin